MSVDFYDLFAKPEPEPGRAEVIPLAPHTAGTPYGLAALTREAADVTAAEPGTRNDRLNRAIFALAGLIAGGQLSAEYVHTTLTVAARAAGLNDTEIQATLASGYTAGTQHPRTPAPLTPLPEPTVLAAPSETRTDENAEGEPERERTSWWPRDLEAAITGHNPEPPPCTLLRDDGHAMFYAGKVNGLIGPSESGKTWVALLAVAQELAAGNRVTYLDFEDTENGIVDRLHTLGATDDQLRRYLAYIGPDEALGALQSEDLATHLDAHQPGTVILDGFNAAMTLLGLDLMSNTDATTFAQRLLRPISARGPAVIYIDHTPKNNADTAGGIGAQAKRAMTTGCALRVEVIKEFGKGQDGRLRLKVDKDRPGYVRGASLPGGGTHWAGDAVLTSHPDDTLTIALEAPHNTDSPNFRPTELMHRISDYLQAHGLPASGNEVENAVRGKRDYIRKALDRLVIEGHIERTAGARGGFMYDLNRPFYNTADNNPVTTISAGEAHLAPRPDLAPTSPGRSAQSDVTSPPNRVGDGVAPLRGEVAEPRQGDDDSRPTSPQLLTVDGMLIDPRTGEVIDQ